MFADYPDVVDVDTLCEMLGGISKKLAYKLLASGEISSVKIGRTYKIAKIYVVNYLISNSSKIVSTYDKTCGIVALSNTQESSPFA